MTEKKILHQITGFIANEIASPTKQKALMEMIHSYGLTNFTEGIEKGKDGYKAAISDIMNLNSTNPEAKQ